MALNTNVMIAALEAKYLALMSEFTLLTSSATVSDQGRSISNGQTAAAIQAQMQNILLQISLLEGPACVVSRMRP